MLDSIIIRVLDERSSGRKYPYWMYVIQCRHGGCTWWVKSKTIRSGENEFVDHDLDWHRKES